jgi:hypothetical protein
MGKHIFFASKNMLILPESIIIESERSFLYFIFACCFLLFFQHLCYYSIFVEYILLTCLTVRPYHNTQPFDKVFVVCCSKLRIPVVCTCWNYSTREWSFFIIIIFIHDFYVKYDDECWWCKVEWQHGLGTNATLELLR